MSQTASPAAPRTPARRKWPRWIVYVGWTLLGAALTSAVVTFATFWLGGVHGVELNPYTFARRSYSFYEVPLIRWQVRRIRREDVASVVVDFLEQQKYLPPAKSVPDVWHIVVGTRGTRPPMPGDAGILVHYLETMNAEDQHEWVHWSEQNPKLAGPLWKAVSRLAQDEQYIYLPELFDLARAASDPVAFQAAINKQLATRLLELGLRLQALEEHTEAKKYLAEAAKLDAGNPTIKRALEKSAALAPQSKEHASPTN